jgi:hypothetical protein
MCVSRRVHPMQFYRWQKQIFEVGVKAVRGAKRKRHYYR